MTRFKRSETVCDYQPAQRDFLRRISALQSALRETVEALAACLQRMKEDGYHSDEVDDGFEAFAKAEPFNAVNLEIELKSTAAALGVKAGVLVHPVRLAVTGRARP